jgi:hypothetical protein
MGNCVNLKKKKTCEFLFACNKSDTNQTETCEVNFYLTEGNIFHYLKNKIKKYSIDFEKQLLVDITIKSNPFEIKPSQLYFEIIKKIKSNK